MWKLNTINQSDKKKLIVNFKLKLVSVEYIFKSLNGYYMYCYSSVLSFIPLFILQRPIFEICVEYKSFVSCHSQKKNIQQNRNRHGHCAQNCVLNVKGENINYA